MQTAIRITAITWIIAFCFVGCAQPDEGTGSSSEADLAAIAEAGEQLIAALNEDDIPGILAGLSADHITLAPNEPLLADEQRNRAWHQSRIDSFTFSITFSSEDIRLEGDLAVERWSSVLKLTPRAGGTDIEDESKGLWVWQRQSDGSWKLMWSIWNSDNAIVPNQ